MLLIIILLAVSYNKPFLWANHAKTNLDRHAFGLCSNHLAYIIYTSGSTGKPKGVMIEHKSVINMLLDVKNRYQLCETDRSLQFASISFDASVEEIFGALISGAVLVFRTDAWLTGAREFWALCEKNALTVVNLSTMYWQQLTQDEQIAIPSMIRNIVIGGEAVSSYALATWFKRETPLPTLFNAYGPTETTVNATMYVPTAESLSWQSIGRPTTNTHIYILGEQLQLVPIGIMAEMYIGGVGVARGYLHRDDLTAERFIHHPEFGRLYKTGDLARWLIDGNIEFLGRNDFQVKIRGFRIELGDIETKLNEHSAVSEVVVSTHQDQKGENQLIAYIVSKDNLTLDSLALRSFLKEKIPPFMIPSTFIFLDQFPVTPNGKLDRKALPEPESLVLEEDEATILHPNSIEHQLIKIW